MRNFGHTRAVKDEAGNVIELKDSPARAATVSELGRTFGSDHDKRLVVSLDKGDLITVRPARTRRSLQIKACDLWFYLLRCEANKSQLERARERKARKAERVARERQERAERRLFRGGAK